MTARASILNCRRRCARRKPRRRAAIVLFCRSEERHIAQAAQRLAREVQAGHLRPDDITPDLLQTCLATGDLPLPDLCIRTGGEHRISNFLLWQLAYAELYFSDLFWPDFKHDAMRNALADFASRQRRFGKTSEQVEAGARV